MEEEGIRGDDRSHPRRRLTVAQAADIVIELGDPDSESVQMLKSYRDASVLSSSGDVPDLLVTALAEIVADRVPAKKSKTKK